MKAATHLKSPTATEAIGALIKQWTAAVRDKDLDAIMAYYAPDIVAYDAIIQLQFKGARPTANIGSSAWACAKGQCSSSREICRFTPMTISPSPTGCAVAAGPMTRANRNHPGCVRARVIGASTVNGKRCTSIFQHHSIWKAARPCSSSSPDGRLAQHRGEQ